MLPLLNFPRIVMKEELRGMGPIGKAFECMNALFVKRGTKVSSNEISILTYFMVRCLQFFEKFLSNKPRSLLLTLFPESDRGGKSESTELAQG